MARREIKHFKSSREGKTALRNYCRYVLRRYEKRWAEGHNWTDYDGVFHDESVLVNRIGIRIVKWDPYFHAAIVCVYDKTQPVEMNRFDGQEYKVFHTWNDMDFYHVWEMVNRVANRILKLPY